MSTSYKNYKLPIFVFLMNENKEAYYPGTSSQYIPASRNSAQSLTKSMTVQEKQALLEKKYERLSQIMKIRSLYCPVQDPRSRLELMNAIPPFSSMPLSSTTVAPLKLAFFPSLKLPKFPKPFLFFIRNLKFPGPFLFRSSSSRSK